jgi:hypothetical protein
MNSPSDIAFAERDNAAVGGLTFNASVVNGTFNANNSVLNGINPQPNQFTGGEGPVTGQEILLDVTLRQPFNLPADRYFIVPQVLLSTGDNFFWLSAPKRITPPLFPGDLQSWIRNENLAPDWLLRLSRRARGGPGRVAPPPARAIISCGVASAATRGILWGSAL